MLSLNTILTLLAAILLAAIFAPSRVTKKCQVLPYLPRFCLFAFQRALFAEKHQGQHCRGVETFNRIGENEVGGT